MGIVSLEKALKVAVSGWDLSHNAAGRVLTLAEPYKRLGHEVDVIGCIVGSHDKHLWLPMQNLCIPAHYFYSTTTENIVQNAITFVKQHHYDVVHLSKPRIPNIVIGYLYKIIWGSKIIMDIDDEELAFHQLDFVNKQQLLNLSNLIKEKINCLPHSLKNPFWTQVGVSLYDTFDSITVSNEVLQKKYGGIIIPHVRDENVFTPSTSLTKNMRQVFGIPNNRPIILFFGTPKRHKGLVETAKALQKIHNQKPLYVIVGDFTDHSLKKELLAISNVDYVFISDQSYEISHKIVAIGDICILMQDVSSPIAQYQLPAKLVDALAMGLKVFATGTPVLSSFILQGMVEEVTEKNLAQKLNKFIIENRFPVSIQQQREFFLENLSVDSALSTINKLTDEVSSVRYLNQEVLLSKWAHRGLLSFLANYNKYLVH